MKDPVYEVGDKVTIRSEYHEGFSESSYACHFTKGMLDIFGGKEAIIKTRISDKKYPGGFYYKINIDKEFHCWSAYMFKESGDPLGLVDKLIQKELSKGWHGDIEGFPKEVVEKMLQEQIIAGNKINISVFERRRTADTKHGGFDWNKTKEGFDFWSDIIDNCDWSKFNKEYNISIQQTLSKSTEQSTQNNSSLTKLKSSKNKILFNPIKNIYYGKN